MSMTGSDFRSYVLRLGFKRTDKDTELYEAVTDAAEIMRRSFSWDEAETEKTTTDTITTLGDFKLAVETDLGAEIGGLRIEDGDFGATLIYVSKSHFDVLYPSINVSTSYGFPRHFTVYGGSIWLGPAPDQTSYVYRITYAKSLGGTAITSATTSVPFTDQYRDILADLTLSRLYDSLGEPGLSDRYFARYLNGLEGAKSRERKISGETYFHMRMVDF